MCNCVWVWVCVGWMKNPISVVTDDRTHFGSIHTYIHNNFTFSLAWLIHTGIAWDNFPLFVGIWHFFWILSVHYKFCTLSLSLSLRHIHKCSVILYEIFRVNSYSLSLDNLQKWWFLCTTQAAGQIQNDSKVASTDQLLPLHLKVFWLRS